MFLPLDPVNYNVSLNATAYVAEITVDTPLGTPVIYFAVSINNSAFTITPNIFLNLAESADIVQRTFRFSNGMVDEGLRGVRLIPDSTNTITVASQIQFAADPRNGSDPVFLPDTYEINIHVLVNGPPVVEDRRVNARVTVNPPTGE